MKVKVYDLKNKSVGEVTLSKEVFGLDVRQDLIKNVVEWQMAKRRAGTHKTKVISDVSGTTKKPFKQKGTGNARQGSLRSVQMRGGAISHGPVPRSHAIDLPKKVRKLALCHVLSLKKQLGKLHILENLDLPTHKTTEFAKIYSDLNAKSCFVITGEVIEKNLALATGNLHYIKVASQIGANVYDIMKHDVLVMTKEAIATLEKRLING